MNESKHGLGSTSKLCDKKAEALQKRRENRKKKQLESNQVLMSVKPPHGFIMLPNGDHRCQYTRLFLDALQTCETAKLEEFLTSHCDPAVNYIMWYDGTSPFGIPAMEVVGVEAICSLWDALIKSAPDVIFSSGKVSGFHEPISGKAFVSGEYNSTLTRLVEVDLVVEEKEILPPVDRRKKPKITLLPTRNVNKNESCQQAQPIQQVKSTVSLDELDSSDIADAVDSVFLSSENPTTKHPVTSIAAQLLSRPPPPPQKQTSNGSLDDIDSLTDNLTSLSFYAADPPFKHVIVKESSLSKSGKLVPEEIRNKECFGGWVVMDINENHKITRLGYKYRQLEPNLSPLLRRNVALNAVTAGSVGSSAATVSSATTTTMSAVATAPVVAQHSVDNFW